MKRLLLACFFILLILFLLAAVALFVFLPRFDANTYRPYVAAKISEMLQAQVELGNLALTWKGGLGFRADGLSVRKSKGEVPFFDAEAFIFRVNPFLLLRQRLILLEVELIRPNILLVKKSAGEKNWKLLAPRTGGASSAGSFRFFPGLGRIALLFTEAHLQEGNLRYRDETQSPPLSLGLEEIRATLRQSVPGGPVRWVGAGRVLSGSRPDLKWEAVFYPHERKLDFRSSFEEDRMTLKGEVFPFGEPPQFSGEIRIRELALETLFALLERGRGPVVGILDADVTFQGRGKNLEEVQSQLVGNGAFRLRDGAFLDRNLVNSVLNRMTPVPGLNTLLVGTLPEPWGVALKNRDTRFEHLEAAFSIEEKIARIQPLAIKSDNFELRSAGTVDFQGNLNFQARLILEEKLSEFLTGRVHELAFLNNPEHQVVIPFLYRGRWPEAHPQPDLGYVAQKLIVQQGQRLVELVTTKLFGEPSGETQ